MKHLLCLGMGYSARALAGRLGAGWTISGTYRSREAREALAAAGYGQVAFDGSEPLPAGALDGVTHLLYPDKGLDLILANDVSDPGIGFNSDDNEVTAIWPGGEQRLERADKDSIARQIITLVAARMAAPCAAGAEAVDDLAAALVETDLLMTSLPGPAQVEQVAFAAPAVFRHLPAGAGWIEPLVAMGHLDAIPLGRVDAVSQVDVVVEKLAPLPDEIRRAPRVTYLTVLGGDRVTDFPRPRAVRT